jgi:conjugative transposon TraN protein
MKNFRYVFYCFLMAFPIIGKTQGLNVIKMDSNNLMASSRQKKLLEFKENNTKGSYPVSVAFYKTTHIVFDSPIKYFDAGSDRIICDKVEGVENVLKVKAAQMGIFETNVTVITFNGSYYSFLVSYNEMPNKLNINMCAGLNESFDYSNFKQPEKIIFSDTYYTESEMISFSKKMIDLSKIKKKSIHHIADKVGKVAFQLTNIGVKEGNIIFCITMKNTSPLDYGLEYMKFFVRDKTKRKKEVSQEIEIKPNFAYVERNGLSNETKLGVAGGEFSFVFMIPKFSMATDKNLEIDIAEKDGSRNMNLKVDYETFYYQMTRL